MFDVRDPENPEHIGEFRISSGLQGWNPELICQGDTLFFTEFTRSMGYPDDCGLIHIIDISNPAEPVAVDSIITDVYLGCITILDGFIFAVDRVGLKVFSPDDSSGFTLIGLEEFDHSVVSADFGNRSICINGDRLYYADYTGMYFFDIEDFDEPQLIRNINIEDHIKDIKIVDNTLYTCGYGMIKYYSLERPEYPSLLGFTYTPGHAENMIVEDNICYLADFYNVSIYSFGDSLTSVNEDHSDPPLEFKLFAAYPNPFNSNTLITYNLPPRMFTRLTIHDLIGREVGVLHNGTREPGVFTTLWDGKSLPSGTYFARLDLGDQSQLIKLTLIR